MHPDFHPGMLAFSDDGQELGEVQKLDEDNLTIEKGRFFSTDRRLPYDAVSAIQEDHLIISRSQADLQEWKTPDYEGLQEPGRADIEEAQIGASVPIYQRDLEELERTEQNADATAPGEPGPPDAERVQTEHTPEGQAGPMSGGESFGNEEVRIPVRDEEAEVRRRPVTRGETQVRREDAQVKHDPREERK
jgi:hypothetical protein